VASLSDVFAPGESHQTPFFSVCSPLCLLLILCINMWLCYVCISWVGTQDDQSWPGRGCAPLSWRSYFNVLVKVSWCSVVLCRSVSCEVESNVRWVLYIPIHSVFTQLLCCCILFNLVSSSCVQDLLSYLCRDGETLAGRPRVIRRGAIRRSVIRRSFSNPTPMFDAHQLWVCWIFRRPASIYHVVRRGVSPLTVLLILLWCVSVFTYRLIYELFLI